MSADTPSRDPRRARRYVPLFQRVAAVNVFLLLAAVVVTIAVLDPDRISSFVVNEEIVVLVAAVVMMGLVNLYVLRRFIRPLQALAALARRVDLGGRSERMPAARPTSEAGELAITFNQMLDRLEAERREATGRVLAGQEAERLRIAQELHDQVGQELTAVLLVLSRLETRAPTELHERLVEIRDEVRSTLENVRRIALELRPEALDDLGLVSALAVLAQRFGEHSGLEVVQSIGPDLPKLTPEVELVVYRVAQEALTNVARHSESSRAEMGLNCDDGHLVLVVADEGRGISSGQPPGTGLRGMRERAALIGATLDITGHGATGGCEVRLVVPLVPGNGRGAG